MWTLVDVEFQLVHRTELHSSMYVQYITSVVKSSFNMLDEFVTRT